MHSENVQANMDNHLSYIGKWGTNHVYCRAVTKFSRFLFYIYCLKFSPMCTSVWNVVCLAVFWLVSILADIDFKFTPLKRWQLPLIWGKLYMFSTSPSFRDGRDIFFFQQSQLAARSNRWRRTNATLSYIRPEKKTHIWHFVKRNLNLMGKQWFWLGNLWETMVFFETKSSTELHLQTQTIPLNTCQRNNIMLPYFCFVTIETHFPSQKSQN